MRVGIIAEGRSDFMVVARGFREGFVLAACCERNDSLALFVTALEGFAAPT